MVSHTASYMMALLRHSGTGQEKRYVHELDSPAQAQWMWTEGNFACDCNRSIFLLGRDVSDTLPCNSDNPTIELIELVVDGERLEL